MLAFSYPDFPEIALEGNFRPTLQVGGNVSTLVAYKVESNNAFLLTRPNPAPAFGTAMIVPWLPLAKLGKLRFDWCPIYICLDYCSIILVTLRLKFGSWRIVCT